MTSRVLRGVVHGNTIELLDLAGLAEGEQVEVVVRALPAEAPLNGQGLLRTEGALADDGEWDAIMSEVHEGRKLDRAAEWGEE